MGRDHRSTRRATASDGTDIAECGLFLKARPQEPETRDGHRRRAQWGSLTDGKAKGITMDMEEKSDYLDGFKALLIFNKSRTCDDFPWT